MGFTAASGITLHFGEEKISLTEFFCPYPYHQIPEVLIFTGIKARLDKSSFSGSRM